MSHIRVYVPNQYTTQREITFAFAMLLGVDTSRNVNFKFKKHIHMLTVLSIPQIQLRNMKASQADKQTK